MGEKETATSEALRAQTPRKDDEAASFSEFGDAGEGPDALRATTVKGSKSNSSERLTMLPEAEESTTVKSGKSNSSDRMQDQDESFESTVKSSKSNRQDRLAGSPAPGESLDSSVKSSKSNTSD